MNFNKILSWFRLNLANIITLSAFPLCIALLWVVIVHRDWTKVILGLLLGIFLTDFLDGKVARYLKIVGSFGSAADRLRDKLVLGIMFLFLILDERIHISLKIVTIPIAVLETILLILWFMGVQRKLDVSAGKYGKIKMFLISIALLLCIMNLVVEERWGVGYHLWATSVLNVMFVVSIFFAVRSFLGHRTQYLKQLSVK